MRLRGGELAVGELAEPLEMSWPAVTKHLKVLEAAGLLERRREGLKHVVSLNATPIKEAGQWMDFYRQFWAGSLASEVCEGHELGWNGSFDKLGRCYGGGEKVTTRNITNR